MAEVAAVEPCGLSVVSLFSGCGGSCLGFRMAGYRIAFASEFVEAARESYRANSPDVPLDPRDVRDLRPEDVLEAAGLRAGEADVLEGSPPCSSFSQAGKRQRLWGQAKAYSDTVQRTDDLFFEYARLLEGIRPRAFVAENVAGLVRGTSKGHFKAILARLRGAGYRVEARLLDSQWLGVPQARVRLIFVGVREDLDRAPAFPRPLPYRYSIREAIPWLTALRGGNKANYGQKGLEFSVDRPAPTITGGDTLGLAPFQFEAEARVLVERSVGLRHSRGEDLGGGHEFVDATDSPAPAIVAGRTVSVAVRRRSAAQTPEGEGASLDGTAIGVEWDRLPPGGHSKRYYNLLRTHPDRPCPTITQAAGVGRGTAGVTHPTERRKFSIAELRRLSSFPDDFVLAGTYSQQWERIGRAVPPLMMFAVARTLRDEVLR